ncbi:MAG TPA: hypothetical protein VJ417_16945 [Candidatus Glassbacteria bacterium]|nr:hypothetical protein [Candidatus Glassbacteria bacterium]
MSDPEYLDRVIKLLRANQCRNEHLDGYTRIDQLEIDSVHLTRFLLDLEKELQILVPDEARVPWVCVADIADYAEKYRVDFGGEGLREL